MCLVRLCFLFLGLLLARIGFSAYISVVGSAIDRQLLLRVCKWDSETCWDLQIGRRPVLTLLASFFFSSYFTRLPGGEQGTVDSSLPQSQSSSCPEIWRREFASLFQPRSQPCQDSFLFISAPRHYTGQAQPDLYKCTPPRDPPTPTPTPSPRHTFPFLPPTPQPAGGDPPCPPPCPPSARPTPPSPRRPRSRPAPAPPSPASTTRAPSPTTPSTPLPPWTPSTRRRLPCPSTLHRPTCRTRPTLSTT
ncbi:hypothetical protein BDQ17DRAFT_876291 [Cyathus striatus]|nr:hypothetical protein BDQ17DRAFT_876291 [Cyathus striatus]